MAKKKLSKKQAGEKRASLSLRDNKGRFTTNLFKREVIKTVLAKKGFDVSKDETIKDRKTIDDIIKGGGITNTELNREYKKNIEVFSDMLISKKMKSTYANSNQLIDKIEKFKGNIFIKGERISKTKAVLNIQQFRQYLASQTSTPDFATRFEMNFSGDIFIDIPTSKEIENFEQDQEDVEMEDFLAMFEEEYPDMMVYTSSKKK